MIIERACEGVLITISTDLFEDKRREASLVISQNLCLGSLEDLKVMPWPEQEPWPGSFGNQCVAPPPCVLGSIQKNN